MFRKALARKPGDVPAQLKLADTLPASGDNAKVPVIEAIYFN